MPVRDACVLDTHAWLWAVADPPRLGRRARDVLSGASVAMVPPICAWELAQLVAEGRLGLDRPVRDWVAQAVSAHPFTLADLSWEVAVSAVDLGREGFHPDPADRLIYATARALGVPLLSADRLLEAFERRLPDRSPRLVVWE